jgi:RNA polymerase sigma factor (sigma-70 family)
MFASQNKSNLIIEKSIQMDTGQKLTQKGERDYILIKRIREGDDQKAYVELYNYYHKSVYYMMYKMTNNPFESEDLTLEAFEKAYQNLDAYVSDYGFSTWLFRIASNNCIDYMRKKVNQVNSVNIDHVMTYSAVPSQLVSGNNNPEETLIKEERGNIVNKLIKKMSPKYRKVIELKYIKEHSMEEISEMLHLPIGTVKAQLFRGREILFCALSKQKEMI